MQFGEEEAACKVERQADWDPSTCTWQPRIARVVERGVEAQQQYNPCTDLSRLHYSPRVHYRSLDIAGWVLLGSCISLVIILAGTTWHYRKKFQLFKRAQMEGKLYQSRPRSV